MSSLSSSKKKRKADKLSKENNANENENNNSNSNLTGKIGTDEVQADEVTRLVVQFQTVSGEFTGSKMEIPLNTNTQQLQLLINSLLKNNEKLPYSFYVNDENIENKLSQVITNQSLNLELTIPIVYEPQSIFRVKAVARCTASLPGHTEAILHTHFSPDGQRLATGAGDATVRIWDVNTETPIHTCKGHKNWVLAVAWSPNGSLLASASLDGDLRIWNGLSGEQIGKPYKGHTKAITSIAWEPIHLNPKCQRLATASKDGTVRVWDIVKRQVLYTISAHTLSVTCLKWGGQGLIYSSSQDRTIKVWDSEQGKLVRTLEGHAHWVNTLSLNTDYAMRTGAFNYQGQSPETDDAIVTEAKKKYETAIAGVGELLVSGSDDFTLILWDPTKSKKIMNRMTGHQQPVNHVLFSPDGRSIASASFDKSVRLWNGHTGKFITTFRGHVQAVYQVSWSADSRLLVSTSKDSTIKLWDLSSKKMLRDLPGHADEVFASDWSPDGERLASGGKDHLLKFWRN